MGQGKPWPNEMAKTAPSTHKESIWEVEKSWEERKPQWGTLPTAQWGISMSRSHRTCVCLCGGRGTESRDGGTAEWNGVIRKKGLGWLRGNEQAYSMLQYFVVGPTSCTKKSLLNPKLAYYQMEGFLFIKFPDVYGSVCVCVCTCKCDYWGVELA